MNVTGGHYNLSDSNSCMPFEEYFESSPIDTVTSWVIFGFLYSCILFISITANILILFVAALNAVDKHGVHVNLLRPRCPSQGSIKTHMSTTRCQDSTVNVQRRPTFSVRTVFVISLACSDLLTTIASLPVTALNIFAHRWLLGKFLCRSIGFVQGFAIFQSSFTFTCIAVDRYLLVAHPDAKVITYKTAHIMMAMTAIMACVLATPMYIFVDVVSEPGVCGEFCVERWSAGDSLQNLDHVTTKFGQRFYSLFVLALQFGLPALVTAVCYILIAVRLRQRHKRRLANASCRSEAERRSDARRRRMNRMMSAMVFAFVIAWLPFNILSLARDFQLFNRVLDGTSFNLYFAAAHVIAMTTLVWNPIIYAWYNRWIRDALLMVLRGGEKKHT